MKIAIHRLQFHSLRENTRAEAGNATEHAKASKEMISACMLPFFNLMGSEMKISSHHLKFLSLRENTRVEAGNVNEHAKPNKELTHRLHFHCLRNYRFLFSQ